MPQIHMADTRSIRVRAARASARTVASISSFYAVEVLLTAPRVVEVVSGRGGRPRWALPSASTSSRAAQTRRRSAIGERHTKMKKFGFAMRNLDKR